MKDKLPFPRAIGSVTGSIKDFNPETRLGTFALSDGQEIPCSLRYKGNIDELFQQQPLQYTGYPTTLKDGRLALKICGPAKQKREAEEFSIIGQIKHIGEDVVTVDVWSNQIQKNFRVILHGFLQANKGEYWKLTAVLENNRLELLDGEKIADSFNPNQLESKPIAVTVMEQTQAITATLL